MKQNSSEADTTPSGGKLEDKTERAEGTGLKEILSGTTEPGHGMQGDI
jgi:hypothetical protein